MLVLLALGACDMGDLTEPEGGPPRVAPTQIAEARSWVRTVVTDGSSLYWANYDVSTGRSARAVVDRTGAAGGERQELVVEPHPPEQLDVDGGFLYWSYELGPLKRVALAGGEPEVLLEHTGAKCFDADGPDVFLMRDGDVVHVDPATRENRVIARKALGDCVVALGDALFWTERKQIATVPRVGGEPTPLVELNKPDGLVVFDGALYTCVDDVLTRVDPSTGETKPIRSYCHSDGLAVSENGHWFRREYFEGWPPQEHQRIAEVTSEGVSWLFDGLGVSSVAIADGHVIWFGRAEGSGGDWKGYRAPLP
ncbi:MAG: hypothetical protein R3F61_05500 [Myxococcota bacterium]